MLCRSQHNAAQHKTKQHNTCLRGKTLPRSQHPPPKPRSTRVCYPSKEQLRTAAGGCLAALRRVTAHSVGRDPHRDRPHLRPQLLPIYQVKLKCEIISIFFLSFLFKEEKLTSADAGYSRSGMRRIQPGLCVAFKSRLRRLGVRTLRPDPRTKLTTKQQQCTNIPRSLLPQARTSPIPRDRPLHS